MELKIKDTLQLEYHVHSKKKFFTCITILEVLKVRKSKRGFVPVSGNYIF